MVHISFLQRQALLRNTRFIASAQEDGLPAHGNGGEQNLVQFRKQLMIEATERVMKFGQ